MGLVIRKSYVVKTYLLCPSGDAKSWSGDGLLDSAVTELNVTWAITATILYQDRSASSSNVSIGKVAAYHVSRKVNAVSRSRVRRCHANIQVLSEDILNIL